jgi:hypothetical protein
MKTFNPVVFEELSHRLHTPSAQRRMLGMHADIREVLPAAGAFVMAGFRHDGGEVGAAGDCSDLIHAPARISER